MKFLNLETLTDFVCTGSDCPFTCCGFGWKILIDEETDRYYRSVEGKMGERLSKAIKRENGKSMFIMNEHGNCPFLNERGLCDIYINLGEEHLSNTCTYYPRYMYNSGDIRFAGVSISCPEVAQFFLNHKEPLLMDFGEDELPAPEEESCDWVLFNNAIRVFSAAVEILQNRDLHINERIALIVIFIQRFQSQTDEGSDLSATIELFSDPSSYIQLLTQTGIYNRDYDSKLTYISEMLGYYSNIDGYEKMLPELSGIISFFSDPERSSVASEVFIKAYQWTDAEENSIWQEQVLVYLLFRYFMQGFSDRRFYDKLMTALILVNAVIVNLVSLHIVQKGEYPSTEYKRNLISHISRLIEHDPNARDNALEQFRNQGLTNPAFVLRLIS